MPLPQTNDSREPVTFQCGDTETLASDYVDWLRRNNKLLLCRMCTAKLFNIRSWGTWGEEERNQLRPFGGKFIVKEYEGARAIAIISRFLHNGRRRGEHWIRYNGKKYVVIHGKEFDVVHLSEPYKS